MWTKTITPQSATSRFIISFSCMLDTTSVNNIGLMLFRGTTFIGATAAAFTKGTSAPEAVSMMVVDAPATASAVTYTVYYGVINATAATININKTSSNTLNNLAVSCYVIQETAA
jgi:hypothetical protein